MTIDLAKLTATLPESAIEWRVQQAGEKNGKVWAIVVPYADARYLLDVLDAACGPENWRDEYSPGPNGGVLCRLSLRFGDEWITKEDGADNTDIEGVKGGITDSFKRACVKWNVAGIRALYNVGDALFATVVENGRFHGQTKQGTRFRWNPPRLNLSSSSPAGASEATGSYPRGQQRPQGEGRASARPTTPRTRGGSAEASTKDGTTSGTDRAAKRSPLTIDQRIEGALDSLEIRGAIARWHAVTKAAGVDPSIESLTEEQKNEALAGLIEMYRAKQSQKGEVAR